MIEYTVSQIIDKLTNALNTPDLNSVVIKGEITNCKLNGKKPNLYFSLKDDYCAISCLMFNNILNKIDFTPANGDKVIIIGKPNIYGKTGSLNIIAYSMKKEGLGDLLQKFEELKKKLSAKGFFDDRHKKIFDIKYINDVGVIVGDKSAAMSDIIKIFNRRWPLCKLTFYPSLVQGDKAAPDLIKNLLNADKANHQALIIARGGGTIEDLFCFNDEKLVETIYNLNTFIVSGVGHEQDFTLCDFVCDKRASTPTAAGEFLTPNIIDVIQDVDNSINDINDIMNTKIKDTRKSIELSLLNIKNYSNKLLNLNKDIDNKKEKMKDILNNKLSHLKEYIKSKSDLIKIYSIDDTLKRGYSIIYKDNKIINTANSLKKNDEIDIKLYKSKLKALVKEI